MYSGKIAVPPGGGGLIKILRRPHYYYHLTSEIKQNQTRSAFEWVTTVMWYKADVV
jgi:hypothetical protein